MRAPAAWDDKSWSDFVDGLLLAHRRLDDLRSVVLSPSSHCAPIDALAGLLGAMSSLKFARVAAEWSEVPQ